MSGLTRCVAVAAAALMALSATPAHAAIAAPAESTIRGTLTSDGHPVAGVRVGTWNPSRGAIATTVTDSGGAFALISPATVPVDLWAGAQPTADRAVFRAGGLHLIRGVVGRETVRGTAGPLWQVVHPVLPGRMNGGRPVHLRLQEAGRFTSAVARGGDGTIALVRVQDDPYQAEARRGRIDSGWLVPGRYRVRWNAAPGRLPVVTTVRVAAGTTAVAAPTLPKGTTVSIHATSGRSRVGSGVRAVEVLHGSAEDAGTTDGGGTITLRDVAPGRHIYVIGRGAVGADGAQEVPVTDDRFLPAAVTVEVRSRQPIVHAEVRLKPAGRIDGRVTAPARHPVLVVAEDAAGVPVRTATVRRGTFALGGLPAGTYRLLAEDTRAGRYSDRRVVVAAGATVVQAEPLTPSTREPVLTGHLADQGDVILRSAVDLRVFRRQVQTDRFGRFQMRVFPGRFTPVAFVGGRTQAIGRPILVTTSTRVHVPTGSREAAVHGRGRIDDGTVPITPVLAGPRTINEEFDQAAPFTDLYSTTAQGSAFLGTHLPAGNYMVRELDGTVPVQDGPWRYRVQHTAFRLTPDRTTDIGDVRLQIVG